jgi:hypothetical protein
LPSRTDVGEWLASVTLRLELPNAALEILGCGVGYDIHITRAETSWSDPPAAERRISKAEWLRYRTRDPQLSGSCDEQAGGQQNLSDETASVCAVYAGPEGLRFPILWIDGRLDAKDPPPKVMIKLCSIAADLRARVQGDEDEYYCSR